MNPLVLATATRALAKFGRRAVPFGTGAALGVSLPFGGGGGGGRRRRRRGIPKTIMADIAQVKAILGPKAASEALQVLLTRG